MALYRFIFIAFFAVLTLPVIASAQDGIDAAPPALEHSKQTNTQDAGSGAIEKDDTEKQDNAPVNPYADYPQELLDNAQRVFDTCKNDRFKSQHYDCKCRAISYLDESIHFAPGTPISNVMLTIGNNCPNRVEMAGTAYSECMDAGVAMNVNEADTPRFCECYGRQYSDNIAMYKGQMDSKLLIAARKHAIQHCKRSISRR